MPPKTAGLGRKRKKKRSRFMELPHDILFEVFKHLAPRAILRLSRTSKELRALLLNRDCAFVWRRARANAPGTGFPALPDDLSEPAYAHLAFSEHCHNCLKYTTAFVYWALRVRLCKRCAKTLVAAPGSYLADGRIPVHIYVKGLDISLQSDIDSFDGYLREHQDPQERAEYFAEREAVTGPIMEHAKLCWEWMCRMEEERARDLAEERAERLQIITERLCELGWAYEISQLLPEDALRGHRLVASVTAGNWRKIGPALVQYMEAMRAARLARAHQAVVARREDMFIRLVFPHLNMAQPPLPLRADWLAMPLVRVLLDQPAGAPVDAAAIMASGLNIAQLVERWRRETRVQLLAHVQKEMSWAADPANLLHAHAATGDRALQTFEHLSSLNEHSVQLATTVFVCSQCSDPNPQEMAQLYWPAVLSHVCADSGERSVADLRVETRLFRTVADVVALHRTLDPATTCARDLDAWDARIACLRCVQLPDGAGGGSVITEVDAPVMTWRAAVHHHHTTHAEHEQATLFHLVTAPEAARARSAESGALAQRLQDWAARAPPDADGTAAWLASDPRPRMWKCRLCLNENGLPGAAQQELLLRHHLRTAHGVASDGPLTPDWCFADPEFPQGFRTGCVPPPTLLRVQLQSWDPVQLPQAVEARLAAHMAMQVGQLHLAARPRPPDHEPLRNALTLHDVEQLYNGAEDDMMPIDGTYNFVSPGIF